MSIPVSRVLSPQLVTSGPDETVLDVVRDMERHGVGCAVVLEAGELRGIFTERDVLQRVVRVGKDPARTPVRDVMTRDVKLIAAATPVSTACEFLNRHGFRHVPVEEDGRLIGVVSMRDLFRVRIRHVEASLGEEAHRLQEARTLLALEGDARFRALLDVNRELETLALTDALTGLFNHRYFMQRLVQEVARARRLRAPLALMFVDIDCFKRVNETCGRTAGDDVLHQVAAVLRSAVEGRNVLLRLRRSDIVARYGGNEFAVLMPDTDAAGTFTVGERIREAVAVTPTLLEDGARVRVTVSVGGAVVPDSADDADALIRGAADALLAAKSQGRNRVLCAEALQRASA